MAGSIALTLLAADVHCEWCEHQNAEQEHNINMPIQATTLQTNDMPITREQFHNAMSRFGASVSIVTTAGPAGRCGLTVSSVTSVSDDPPVVLVCVNQNARTCNLISLNGVFSVSLLNRGTEKLADAFAGRQNYSVDERFALADWHHGLSGDGAPMLPDAPVALECAVADSKDAGTHRVFFGLVQNALLGQHEGSLFYLNRRYHVLPK